MVFFQGGIRFIDRIPINIENIMRNFRYNYLSLFLALVAFLSSCEQEDMVSLPVEMSTWKNDKITSTSADLSGFVVARGDGFSEQGICYGIKEGVTINDNIVVATELDNAIFWVKVEGLEHLTTYYYKAYVKDNSGEIIYGKESSFATLAHTATAEFDSEKPYENLTATSIILNAAIPYDGKSPVTARGVCYSRSEEPTIENDKVANGEGIGVFAVDLKDLWSGVKYNARVYATNKIGTSYSDVLNFETLPGLGVIGDLKVVVVDKQSATMSVEILHNGGVDLAEAGFIYGKEPEPSFDNSLYIAEAQPELGILELSIPNLEEATKYYVRAFVKNEHGIKYSSSKEFTTKADIITWYVPGSYVESSYPESNLINWEPIQSPIIQNSIDSKTHLEGYVYMADAKNKWKLSTGDSFESGINYGAGENGTLSSTGGDIEIEAGYYLLEVDSNAVTGEYAYKATKTSWGIIGTATANGWDSDIDLTYDPKLQIWKGIVHLGATGDFKFRANDNWTTKDYAGNTEKLIAGGANFPSPGVESDYAITLDLSTPNNYTCSFDRWGIIGTATPGGWDNDTDLMYNSETGLLEATLDLEVGDFKFRANDAWSIDLGGSLSNLSQGGANIAIEEKGNYTVRLDVYAKVATITLN